MSQHWQGRLEGDEERRGKEEGSKGRGGEEGKRKRGRDMPALPIGSALSCFCGVGVSGSRERPLCQH